MYSYKNSNFTNQGNITNRSIKSLFLNFGPQHPAAHGVLRIILELLDEVILKTDIHIGLLHRGSEKLIENKIYLHSIPHFDRMDYVSTIAQESGFCLAIEKLLCVKYLKTPIVLTRTIFDELTRILNHYLAVSCHALDVGSMSPLFWAFEEREKILYFYESISGARMHAVLYRPTSINRIISTNLKIKILIFLKTSYKVINDIHNTLSNNKIWISRLYNNMVFSQETALKYGLTGIMLRSVGNSYDLRLLKKTSYNFYPFLKFYSFLGSRGDSLDRYYIRMFEILESLSIVSKLLLIYSEMKMIGLNKNNSTMERVIDHFKSWSSGILIKKNYSYFSVESPKGEFGVTLISNNTNKPTRCKIRSPSYYNLQFLGKSVINYQIPDLVTMIGTIDIVLGEIDR